MFLLPQIRETAAWGSEVIADISPEVPQILTLPSLQRRALLLQD